MCLLNSVNAEHISTRTEGNTNCSQKTYAIRPEKLELIMRKDNLAFEADRKVFVGACLVGGTALGYKAKS